MRVNPNFAPTILDNVWNAQADEQAALQELSTGRSVNLPSDNPVAFAGDLQNQALQAQNDQYQRNTSDLESMFQTADSALSSVVTALNHAISLGTEGANGTLSASDQQALATQAQAIQAEVIQYANTSFQGHYIFSGTATGTQPFVLDSTQPSGVRYDGNTTVNDVQIAQARSIAINVPGSQVFMGSGNVMASLQQLVTSLQTGNSSAIGAATQALNSSLNYVSQQRMFYGSSIQQLNANQSSLQQEKVDLQTQDTKLVGADMAQAATELAQATTTHDAALAALAKVIPTSLLDYLK